MDVLLLNTVLFLHEYRCSYQLLCTMDFVYLHVHCTLCKIPGVSIIGYMIIDIDLFQIYIRIIILLRRFN